MTVRAVSEPLSIPLDVDHMKVVTHARRVAALTLAWTAATSAARQRDQAAYGALLPIGTALSWAVDLGLIGDFGATGLSLDDVRTAAFPTTPKTGLFREAIATDAPRFEPAHHAGEGCPVGGPRGGRCPGWKQTTKWVTDMETGVWEYRGVCPAHVYVAERRASGAPSPPRNRGGVLAAVFPEVDVDALYAWARPGWVPVGSGVPGGCCGCSAGVPPRRRWSVVSLTYRDGSPCDGRVTVSDMAREPRSAGVVAWFDGWGQATGLPPSTFSRRLTAGELRAWREGWVEGKADHAAWEVRVAAS